MMKLRYLRAGSMKSQSILVVTKERVALVPLKLHIKKAMIAMELVFQQLRGREKII